MSVRRIKVFDGVLSASQVNLSIAFNQCDVILLVVGGLAADEFIEMSGSLNVRVKQNPTTDICDDPIALPDFITQNIPFNLLPPATREIFDMGDYDYPLKIPAFNSYTLVQVDRELSECAFDMSVALVPSFDIQCQVWVLWQDKNVRNLARQVCANEISNSLKFAVLAANQLAQNAALGFNVSALASILAVPTGGSSLALAAPVLSGLALGTGSLTAISLPAVGSAIPLLP